MLTDMGAQMYMRAAYCCKTATTTMRVASVASIGSEAKLLVDWSAVVKGWHIALPTFNTHSLSYSYTATQTNTQIQKKPNLMPMHAFWPLTPFAHTNRASNGLSPLHWVGLSLALQLPRVLSQPIRRIFSLLNRCLAMQMVFQLCSFVCMWAFMYILSIVCCGISHHQRIYFLVILLFYFIVVVVACILSNMRVKYYLHLRRLIFISFNSISVLIHIGIITVCTYV